MILHQNQHYKKLSQKWTARSRDLRNNLWHKHGETLGWLTENYRQLAAGSLSGLLLLASPHNPQLPPPSDLVKSAQEVRGIDKKATLISELSTVLPSAVRVLTDDEEKRIAEILSNTFGFRVAAELDSKKLNRSYGLIGLEQHLARFPGDNMAIHFDTTDEARNYYADGMAPGLGAWGYFARSKEEFKEKDKMREKYYLAVQTFLVPDYNQRVAEYRDFFKYRKMLAVNPENGKAMVVVIGDAGPAAWTGKHLGGSPEVMRYLERVDGAARGPVLYFFIDDPNDTIPLGPIETGSVIASNN
ncbi:MAG: hypothetical protein ACD_50C00290G0003 [uncultured bacterium]|nr:MAG: hypothetical protein ACD_50C00290G0003 [uncultured bacterium]OGH13079.1 MAG: hypothetical protein A2687_00255 [Candidatus Levybacteria bacterium RIFCSPHIGHO2_01_FULL_38_26]